MRRETALSILLVMGSAGCGSILAQRWGFNPLFYAARMGLTGQATITLLSMAMLCLLTIFLAQDDADSQSSADRGRRSDHAAPEASSHRPRAFGDPFTDEETPMSLPDGVRVAPKTRRRFSPGDTQDEELELPAPEEIDPTGEWPKPTGPTPKAEGSR